MLPARAMFGIHHSILYKCITFGAIMLALSIGISFSPCKTQCGFPQTFPFTTLEAFGARYSLSYSSSTTAWCKQRREKLRDNIQDVCS